VQTACVIACVGGGGRVHRHHKHHHLAMLLSCSMQPHLQQQSWQSCSGSVAVVAAAPPAVLSVLGQDGPGHCLTRRMLYGSEQSQAHGHSSVCCGVHWGVGAATQTEEVPLASLCRTGAHAEGSACLRQGAPVKSKPVEGRRLQHRPTAKCPGTRIFTEMHNETVRRRDCR